MPEEDAFAVMVRLMQGYRLRELFKPSMAELGLCMYKLEYLIQASVWHHSTEYLMQASVWHQSIEYLMQAGVWHHSTEYLIQTNVYLY